MPVIVNHVSEPESFEWFIMGQAFSPSYDLAPLPVSKLDRRDTGKLKKRDHNLLTGGEEGMG